MAERLGIYDSKMVTIKTSSSGLDETMFPRVGFVEARLGPSEDAEILSIDVSAFTWSNLRDNGNGCYQVDAKSIKGDLSFCLYIAK